MNNKYLEKISMSRDTKDTLSVLGGSAQGYINGMAIGAVTKVSAGAIARKAFKKGHLQMAQGANAVYNKMPITPFKAVGTFLGTKKEVSKLRKDKK